MGSQTTKVGIAGVGAMGMGIAKALLARGFAVHVRDIVAARENEALAAGAKGFPAELDVLVSVVVDAAQTRDVIGEHAKRAPAFMMCSTIAPQDVEQIAAQLDAHRVGYELTAFVSAYCAADLDYDAFTAGVQALNEVLEIHSVAGDETYVLKVVTRDTAHLDDFLTRLKRIPGVARTRTTIVLATPFERGGLPVEALG